MHICLFYLSTKILGILGLVIYSWKGIEKKKLPKGILGTPKTCNIIVAKQKIKICSHLVTACQGGQKNRNEKTTAVLFSHSFLLVIYV